MASPRRFLFVAALAAAGMLTTPGCLPSRTPLEDERGPVAVNYQADDHYWVYFPEQSAYYCELHDQYWVQQGDEWVLADDVDIPDDAQTVVLGDIDTAPYLYEGDVRGLNSPRGQESLPAGFSRDSADLEVEQPGFDGYRSPMQVEPSVRPTRGAGDVGNTYEGDDVFDRTDVDEPLPPRYELRTDEYDDDGFFEGRD